MNTLVVFESKYGNTQKVARAIADTLKKQVSAQIGNAHDSRPCLKDINLLVVGCPTQKQGLSPEMAAYLNQIPDLNGICAATFDTRHKGPKLLSGSAATVLAKELRQKGA